MREHPVPAWITVSKQGVTARLHIQPKAARTEISGEYGDGSAIRLKIRVAAPPVDGAANEELIRFLKKLTGLPSSQIHIIRGESSKAKDILFERASVDEIVLKMIKLS